MKGIRQRLILLIATAAVAPLLLFGIVSIRSLRDGTEESIANGKIAVARQVATGFRDYFANTARMLRSIASQWEGAQLTDWQRERVLKSHVIDFPEFRDLAAFDASGVLICSSRSSATTLRPPSIDPGSEDLIISSPVPDEAKLPSTRVAVPLRDAGRFVGWIVAELALEELWREVDAIRSGEHGYAMLIDTDGRIIAHGDPDQKTLIATGSMATAEQRGLALLNERAARPMLSRITVNGETMVAVGARIGAPDWTVLIEQPEWEALAVSRRLTLQLYLAIGLALAATVIVGSWWGRGFIRRIMALTTVTDALAAGQMSARVSLTGQDEIAQLGRQFNTMADRLVELQEAIRKQERQVMFGKIAAGLVHDLSHPIQSIGNSCKLIQRIYDDAEYRVTFKETIERELATVQRVLEDLLNIAKPIPLVRFPVDVTAALRETVDSMRATAETAGLTLELDVPPQPLHIQADLFAMGRVHRNLVLNAIQATAPGGRVIVGADAEREMVRIVVRDTGSGIPADRLPEIFDDFVTTKRRGLGLGLAISKKIVEQLGGTIAVTSEVGQGTTFVLEFPRVAAPPIAVAG